MSNYFINKPDGYQDSIRKGISAVRRFNGGLTSGKGQYEDNIARLKNEIRTADAIVIGAGAGLSTAAGLTYSGERFERNFPDFIRAFGIRDMYSGGFYPFPDEETQWAWWARHIYFNRYIDPPKPVYADLLALVRDRDYFAITTNVDHQFQRAGFEKSRLFYTQGDYGLFQSESPRFRRTYDNEEWVMLAMEAQGFERDEKGVFQFPADGKIAMRIPHDLIPTCPDDGGKVVMNLRSDDSFVEDEGWHAASAAYAKFLQEHEGQHVLYLEIGVGLNTPVIIKYPFWGMTAENEKAVYACLSHSSSVCPRQIEAQSICLDGDAGEMLKELLA